MRRYFELSNLKGLEKEKFSWVTIEVAGQILPGDPTGYDSERVIVQLPDKLILNEGFMHELREALYMLEDDTKQRYSGVN